MRRASAAASSKSAAAAASSSTRPWRGHPISSCQLAIFERPFAPPERALEGSVDRAGDGGDGRTREQRYLLVIGQDDVPVLELRCDRENPHCANCTDRSRC